MQQSYSDSHGESVCSVYVKNLDTSVSNSDIASHFRSCGTISGINVVGGRSLKKYAVVDFPTDRSVEIALLLNGSVLKGKKIVVQRKKDFNKK